MSNDKKPPAKAQKVSEHATAAYPYASSGRVVDGVRQPHPERWKHEAAAALHGWKAFEHNNNKEVELTAADYESAIEAACKLDSKGIPTPHKSALGAVKA